MQEADTIEGSQERRSGIMQAFRALRYANYRWYWISGIGQTASQGMTQLALPWLILDLTGSVGQLGFAVFVQGLPMAVISLFGGVVADRYDRRKLLVYSQLITMASILILAILVVTGHVEVWHVYVSALFLGATQGVSMPARMAFIRSLVKREDMLNAVGLNSIQMHSSRIIWPAVAGLLIAWGGIGPALFAAVAGSIVGITALLAINGLPALPVPERRSPVRELLEGVRYAWSTPEIKMIVSLGIAIGLFVLSFMHMAPGFARQVMGFSAAETGFFLMFSGVGAVLGSASLVVLDIKNRNRLFVAFCVTFALSLIALSLNPWYLAAYAFTLLFGMASATVSVLAHTIFQMRVPSHLLGRVISLWTMAGGIGSMSALPIGLIGEAYGLRVAVGGGALLFLMATLWLGVFRSPLRVARGNEPPLPASRLPGGS
jgi:MFS family permease